MKDFFEEVDKWAKLDKARETISGFPEIVLCEGKEFSHALEIIVRLAEYSPLVLASRANEKLFEAVKQDVPDAVFHEIARIIQIGESKDSIGSVAIVSGGTADAAVAEEAAVTALALGNKVECFYDVGVAGIHRLLSQIKKIRECEVVIAIAGMEGALPGVVAGLTDKPVIAVPTSRGYGTAFGGIAPLLTSLNACSTVAVMNIDNGVGAALFASKINLMAKKLSEKNAKK